VIEKKISPVAAGLELPEKYFDTTSIAETVDFLKNLFPVTTLWDLKSETEVPLIIEFRGFKDKNLAYRKALPVSELSEITIEEVLNDIRDSHLFFGVGSRKEPGGKASVSYINALWLDVDLKGNRTRQEAIDSLQTFNPEPTYIINSGHGVHAYWVLEQPARYEDFITVEKLNLALKDQFNGDPAVCQYGETMRLPGSINFKLKPVPVIILYNSRKKYSLEEIMDSLAAKIPAEKKLPLDYKRESPVQPGSFSPEIIDKTIEKCHFLRHCRDEAQTLDEPSWYMMISNLAALGAKDKIHELSSPYPRYSKKETDKKIDHALEASKPHTCDYISKIFDDCRNCRWRENFKSPSSIAYSISSGRCYSPIYGHSDFHKTMKDLLSSDAELWKKVLEIAGVELDTHTLQEQGSIKFPDLFGSGNPTRTVYSLFHPGIRYTDFSEKSNFQLHCFANDMNYDIIEVFLALKDGGNPKKAKMTPKELSRFYSWIEEEGITTIYGAAFDEWWNRLEPELNRQFELMAEVSNNRFLDDIRKVTEVIRSEARKNYNNGKEWFMCSVRHVGRLAGGLSKFRVNRAMNFLVLAGFLKKGDETRIGVHTTYKYRLDFLTFPEDIYETWETLEENSLANAKDFKRENVVLAFGEKRANEVFKR